MTNIYLQQWNDLISDLLPKIKCYNKNTAVFLLAGHKVHFIAACGA